MSETGVAVIRARLKLPDTEAFIRAFAPRINSGGMLVRTKQVKPVGSRIRFEFSLESGQRMLLGEGVVRKVRGGDQPGMTIRFTKLNQASKALIDRIVAWKEERKKATERPTVEAPGDPSGDEVSKGTPEAIASPATEAVAADATAQVDVPETPSMADGAGQLLQPGAVLSALDSASHTDSLDPSLPPDNVMLAEDQQIFSMDLDEAELDDVLGNLFGGGGDDSGDALGGFFGAPADPPSDAPIPHSLAPEEDPEEEPEEEPEPEEQSPEPVVLEDSVPLETVLEPSPAEEDEASLVVPMLAVSEDDGAVEPSLPGQVDPIPLASEDEQAQDLLAQDPEPELSPIGLAPSQEEPALPDPPEEDEAQDAFLAMLSGEEDAQEPEEPDAEAAQAFPEESPTLAPVSLEVGVSDVATIDPAAQAQADHEEPASIGSALAEAAQADAALVEPEEEEDAFAAMLAGEDEDEESEGEVAQEAAVAEPHDAESLPLYGDYAARSHFQGDVPSMQESIADPSIIPEDELTGQTVARITLSRVASTELAAMPDPQEMAEDALELREEEPPSVVLSVAGQDYDLFEESKDDEEILDLPEEIDQDEQTEEVPRGAEAYQATVGADSPEDHQAAMAAQNPVSDFEVFQDPNEFDPEEEAEDGFDIDLAPPASSPEVSLEPLRSLTETGEGPTLSAMPSEEISEGQSTPAMVARANISQSTGELSGLLDELQGRSEDVSEPKERVDTLNLASAVLPPMPKPAPKRAAFDEDDVPSLQGLVSAARQEIEVESEAESSPDSILDDVLGELPPPPGRTGRGLAPPVQPIASPEAEMKGRKKGFFSRLFGRD